MSSNKESTKAPEPASAPAVTGDGNAKPVSSKPPEKSALSASARQSASSLAVASQKLRVSTSETPSEFVKFSRAALEFQLLTIQNQLELLDSLAAMSDEEKADTLFDMLDKDKNGLIDARELGEGMRKIDSTVGFTESIDRAICAVAAFAADEDAMLNRCEFKKFLDGLMERFGCNFHELSEILVLQVKFSQGGNNPVEEMVGDMVSEEINEEVREAQKFNKILTDDRMKALFNLFDTNNDGSISFKEVAVGLYKMTNNMEESSKAAIGALLLLDEEDKRTLNYSQFARLILNIIAASSGDAKFDDVADAMTMAQCKDLEMTSGDLDTLLMGDILYNTTKELESAASDLAEMVDALEYGRMRRLFVLWDLDADGSISFAELVLGMRKFQDAKHGIEGTLEEGVATMLEFDENDDQKLDMAEFAMFLVKYAQKSKHDLHELIDFMVVTSALADNDEAERAYMESINADATRQIRAIEKEMRKNDPARRAIRQFAILNVLANLVGLAITAAGGYLVYYFLFSDSDQDL